MIPLPNGIDAPASAWPARLRLALFGACLVLPVLGFEAVLESLLRKGGLPAGEGVAHPEAVALGLVAAHLFLVGLAARVASRGLSGRLLTSGVQGLRARRLAKLFQRHRKQLVAYFAEDEKPLQVVEVDPPGQGVPRRVSAALVVLVGAAVSLELIAYALLRARGLPPGSPATHGATGLGALVVTLLLFGDLDRVRARVVVGAGVVGLAVLAALRPELLTWGPGILPAMAFLMVAVVVRVTREDARTRVLFLTTKGLRLIELTAEGVQDPRGGTLRPDRLVLAPGVGESQWTLLASGHPPLEVQPLGGHAQEIAVAGALHGFPVRITGIEQVEPLARELRGQLRALVPALGILAALAWVHWRPLLASLLPR